MGTMDSLLGFSKISHEIEKSSKKASHLHSVDPALKLCGAIGLSFVAQLFYTAKPLIFMLFFIIIEALASRISFRAFTKRVILLSLFTGVVILPSIFVPFGPPPAIYEIPILNFYISAVGLHRAIILELRLLVSLFALQVVILTTTYSELVNAFRRLKVPKIFVLTLALMLRYIFVIHDEALRISRAREARTTGKMSRMRTIKSIANSIGLIMVRSYERSDKVYKAMLARGFNGNFPKFYQRQYRSNLKYVFSIITLLLILFFNIPNVVSLYIAQLFMFI